MSNLPESVTEHTIDQHYGGSRDDWPGTLTCDHESAKDW